MRRTVALGLLASAAVALSVSPQVRGAARRAVSIVMPRRALAEAEARLGPAARARMAARLAAARPGDAALPEGLRLIAFKRERLLRVQASWGGPFVDVCCFPVLGASGGPGPKLREGDRQVPEGRYRIDRLNPASAFHLSLGLDYPRAIDRERAAAEGRTRLGGDIFVHGGARSVGCLAIGDAAIEELFFLVHDVGPTAVEVLIAPWNPAVEPLAPPPGAPAWLSQDYAELTGLLAPPLAPPGPPGEHTR